MVLILLFISIQWKSVLTIAGDVNDYCQLTMTRLIFVKIPKISW